MIVLLKVTLEPERQIFSYIQSVIQSIHYIQMQINSDKVKTLPLYLLSSQPNHVDVM